MLNVLNCCLFELFCKFAKCEQCDCAYLHSIHKNVEEKMGGRRNFIRNVNKYTVNFNQTSFSG